jgi:hypothetical protein
VAACVVAMLDAGEDGVDKMEWRDRKRRRSGRAGKDGLLADESRALGLIVHHRIGMDMYGRVVAGMTGTGARHLENSSLTTINGRANAIILRRGERD